MLVACKVSRNCSAAPAGLCSPPAVRPPSVSVCSSADLCTVSPSTVLLRPSSVCSRSCAAPQWARQLQRAACSRTAGLCCSTAPRRAGPAAGLARLPAPAPAARPATSHQHSHTVPNTHSFKHQKLIICKTQVDPNLPLPLQSEIMLAMTMHELLQVLTDTSQ